MRSLVLVALLWSAPALAGDKDRDGVPNKDDACREQAEDVDGFEDADGCPDPDNDGDAIEDESDRCPDEPEDADGFEDADGCPDPDNDGDGVLDGDDACDGEIEPAGESERDGCPEVTTKLLTEDGWLHAVGALTGALVAAAGKQAEGCDEAVATSRAWIEAHDPAALQVQFEARLARGEPPFDAEAARELLATKGGLYPQIKPALDIFCAEHPGWSEVVGPLDTAMAPWLEPEVERP